MSAVSAFCVFLGPDVEERPDSRASAVFGSSRASVTEARFAPNLGLATRTPGQIVSARAQGHEGSRIAPATVLLRTARKGSFAEISPGLFWVGWETPRG